MAEASNRQKDHNKTTSHTKIDTPGTKEGSLFHNPEDLASSTQSDNIDSNDLTSISADPHSNYSLFLKKHQPSKQFLLKCRNEQDSLLESIKVKYQTEIKSIYDDELYPDLFIQIGLEFRRALNKSIIASRAFKLYKILKKFSTVVPNNERDIIVCQFQEKTTDNLRESNQNIYNNVSDPEDCDQESVSTLECSLPENIVSPELLLNFIRRVFTHEDIATEELELNNRLLEWLKANKPDLIQTPKRKTPSSRNSFRIINQDFDQLSISIEPIVISDKMNHEKHHDEIELGQNAADDGQFSSLTRTETFELISKTNLDSPNVTTSSKNSRVSDDKADSSAELSNDDTTSQSSYAPTTRTGLKPKTFTTPPGVRNKTSSETSNLKRSAIGSQSVDKSTKSKRTENKTKDVDQDKGLNKGQVVGKTPIPSSRSTKNDTPNKPNALKSMKNTVPGSPSGVVNKLTMITRAQPISMERSQSPATGNIKTSSTTNFIVANKRVVSQTKERLKQQETGDSDADVVDPNSFLLRQVTSENIVSHLDDFTLVSRSKLVESLSKLFIDDILSDTVLVAKDNKLINAHRCILAARSPYFSEIISKQTKQGDAETSNPKNTLQTLNIDISEFSYPVVYFSVMHIYTGLVKIFDDVDIEELGELSGLLHVQTLKEVCIHELKMNYCHFFHKPCNVCCSGVLKALPLAWRYDYTELYTLCLKWIGSHFSSVFCLKEFSELKPNDLIEECYSATLSQLTPENIIPKTIECQKLLKNLPRVKWTESIICLVGRQLEDFCHYVANNYEKILQSESFLNLGKNCWECEILEENLLAAMNHLKPDSGCRTLIQLHKIECSIESTFDESSNVSDSFANLVCKMRKYCERYLLREAATVVHCTSWRQMNPSLQKRIKDQAILTTDFDDPAKQLASKPKLPSMSRSSSQKSSQLGGGSGKSPSPSGAPPTSRSLAESSLKSPNTMYLPQPKNKAAVARHLKVLK